MSLNCWCLAARILESINDTVHPCDDFFEYACGSWNKQHPIPDDASKYDMFSKLYDDLQAKLRGFTLSNVFRQIVWILIVSWHASQLLADNLLFEQLFWRNLC